MRVSMGFGFPATVFNAKKKMKDAARDVIDFIVVVNLRFLEVENREDVVMRGMRLRKYMEWRGMTRAVFNHCSKK